MAFFHIPNYFFLKLLKITFSLKSVGAPNFNDATVAHSKRKNLNRQRWNLEFSAVNMNSCDTLHSFAMFVPKVCTMYLLFPEISQNCLVINCNHFLWWNVSDSYVFQGKVSDKGSSTLHIRYHLRFFDCLVAHPNLSATLATDQKWPLSCLRISYQSLAECHLRQYW